MTIELIDPTKSTFEKLRVGQLFSDNEDGVYIKSNEEQATAIYKRAGMMNAGRLQNYYNKAVVYRIKDATFTIG